MSPPGALRATKASRRAGVDRDRGDARARRRAVGGARRDAQRRDRSRRRRRHRRAHGRRDDPPRPDRHARGLRRHGVLRPEGLGRHEGDAAARHARARRDRSRARPARPRRAHARLPLEGRVARQPPPRARRATRRRTSTTATRGRYSAQFFAAAVAARKAGKGLWGSCRGGAVPLRPTRGVSTGLVRRHAHVGLGLQPQLHAVRAELAQRSRTARRSATRSRSSGSDVYDLDGDGDGYACEAYE